MGTDTDTTLLLRWHGQHDARAFREIASRHSGMVFATCRRVLGDAVEAEDVTQECFLALAQRAATPPDSLPAWLHVLAVRQSLNRRRAASRRTQRERQYTELRSQSSASDWDEIMGEVDEVIAGLPEDLRAVIVLYFLEERSQQEIAEKLAMSQSTVSRRIDDGIAKVRKALANKGVSLSAAALATALRAQAAEALPATLSASLGKLALVANAGSAGTVVSGAGVTAATIGGIILMKKFGLAIGAILIAIGGAWYVTGNLEPEPLPSPAEPIATEEPEPQQEMVADDPEPAPAMAAVPEPESALGSISGRVYDAVTEEGLDGVEITVEWHTKPGEKEEKSASTTSDAFGNYVLANLAAGANLFYRVSRDTPEGYRPDSFMETKTFQLPADGSVKDVNFAVRREVVLKGFAVDVNNRPVGDASIKLSGGMDTHVSKSVTSGRDGSFTFHNLPATSELYVMATKGEDLVSQPYEFHLTEEGITDLFVVLEAACTISGIVVDPAGNSMPNYKVLTTRRPWSRVGSGTDKTTDAAGRFEVRGLAPGPYELAAWNPALKISGAQQTGLAVDLRAGEHLSDLILVYDRQLSIAGWVRNTDGEPISGASVTVGSPQAGGDSTTTDEDGAFKVTNLQQGVYGITVNAMGYMYAEIYGVAAGTLDFEIQMPPPFRITGTVTDARTRQPIPEFELVLTVNWGNELNSWSEKQFRRIVDPNGHFELPQIQTYRSIVAARAQGYATAMQFLDLTGPPYEREVHLKLKAGGDLEGRVLDSRRIPIARANVFYGKATKHGDRATTTTNDEGRFQLKSFPAEGQRVSAYHENYAVGSLYVGPNHNPNQTVEIILPGGGWVQGTVQFADGVTPVPTRVSIDYPDGHVLDSQAEVQQDGTYVIDRVAPGNVMVSLRVNTSASKMDAYSISKSATISEAGVTTVDFEVFPVIARLEGIVVYPDGASPRSVTLLLKIQTYGGEVYKGTQPRADGTFVFANIPAGSGTIEVDANFQNHRRINTTVSVDIPEGESGYVAVQL